MSEKAPVPQTQEQITAMQEHLQSNPAAMEWSAPNYYQTTESGETILRMGGDPNNDRGVRRLAIDPQLRVAESGPAKPVDINVANDAPQVPVRSNSEYVQADPFANARPRREVMASLEQEKANERTTLKSQLDALRAKHNDEDNRNLFFYATNTIEAQKGGEDRGLADARWTQAQDYAAKLSSSAKKDAQTYLDLWIKINRLQ